MGPGQECTYWDGQDLRTLKCSSGYACGVCYLDQDSVFVLKGNLQVDDVNRDRFYYVNGLGEEGFPQFV